MLDVKPRLGLSEKGLRVLTNLQVLHLDYYTGHIPQSVLVNLTRLTLTQYSGLENVLPHLSKVEVLYLEECSIKEPSQGKSQLSSNTVLACVNTLTLIACPKAIQDYLPSMPSLKTAHIEPAGEMNINKQDCLNKGITVCFTPSTPPDRRRTTAFLPPVKKIKVEASQAPASGPAKLTVRKLF